MGNCKSKKVYIAKETYTPTVWADSDDPDDRRKLDLLAVQLDDELVPKTDSAHDSAVTREFTINNFGETFHYMKNKRTKEKGYISSHYMAEKGSIEGYQWYFGKIGRGRAECFLAQECNINGSWLIRESDTKANSYAVSVKVHNDDKHKYEYKHYLIKTSGNLYFITHKQKFSTLPDLADAISKGTIQRMEIKFSNICQRPRPSTFNEIGAATGKFLIAREDVHFGQDDKIGGGFFGEVYKGKFRGTLDVAIKTLKADEDDSEDNSKAERAKKEFHSETDILQQLHHPNLVQVFGICTDTSPFLMIVEYLPKGDLRNMLINVGEKGVTFEQLLSICENIASGMQALEDKGIVHRDLAARNVMVDQWLQAKVGDFGMARQDSAYTNNTRGNIPWKWTAPEAIERRVFTHKSDVWSFGIVLWEIFTFGCVPYPHKKNQEVLGLLKSGYRLPQPEYKTAKNSQMEGVYVIMLSCWLKDDKARPSFETLYNDFHDFETAVEDRYSKYTPKEYMREQNLSNTDTHRRKAKPSAASTKPKPVSGSKAPKHKSAQRSKTTGV